MTILEFKRLTRDYAFFQDFMRIYLDSFPQNEIIDIDLLIEHSLKGHIRLEAVESDGRIIGMHMTTENTPATFIGFIAVDRELRGYGYGGRILDALMSEEKPTFLNVEPPDVPCDNMEQRKSRIEFYRRHGLEMTGYQIDLGSGIFCIMSDDVSRLDAYRETIHLIGYDWPIEHI